MEVTIGIDLGTQGVRTLAIDQRGQLLGHAQERLPRHGTRDQAGLHEQDPSTWWQCTARCLRATVDQLPREVMIAGLAVDSTSGSLVVTDLSGTPVCPAIMYNDTRSQSFVPEVKRAGSTLEASLGYAFNASFALPKMVWALRSLPGLATQQAHRFMSETDFLVGKLSGSFHRSDFSNMLKFGYDLLSMSWPEFLERDLGIHRSALPEVVAPGTCIARVCAEAQAITGIPGGTPIMAGATDGTAAQIASGACEVGAWNSALGTTLVLKGITSELLVDAQQRIYCHRHPEAGWMPGGASNTGADWIPKEYPGAQPAVLDREAEGSVPTSLLRYPLLKQGERFPFSSDRARGFLVGEPVDEQERYASGLEGVALLERLAFDTMEEIGVQLPDAIHITEGGARSELWSNIRASTLDRILLRPKIGQAGLGAAVLAARGVWFDTLSAASQAMVEIDSEFTPTPAWVEAYRIKYERFLSELRSRGYVVQAA